MKTSLAILMLFILTACVTSKERNPSSDEAQTWQERHLRAIPSRR